MSLENKIETLTKAITDLTLKLENLSTLGTLATNPAELLSRYETPVPVAPVVEAPAPVVPVAAPAAPVMPPPPTFMADPVPATAAPVIPFSDGKGLIAYVMDSYKALGAQKGAQIQTVLTNLGYQNIHDVKPEHYAALFAAIEALKV